MGAKKYSDELKDEIRAKHKAGEKLGNLANQYNIPYKSIEYICKYEKSAGTRGCMEHVKSNESAWIDSKFDDARNFKLWKEKLIKKLKAEMKYLGQPIIHIGQSEFTYRCRYGYNDTKCYIDLYTKRRGEDGGNSKG